MTGFTVAVFDNDPEYIRRFLSFAEGSDSGFNVIGFTDPYALGEYLLNAKIAVLLFSAENLNEGEISEEIRQVLDHKNIRRVINFAGTQDPAVSEYFICKYQSMPGILAEVADICKDLRAAPAALPENDCTVHGVYCSTSPSLKNKFVLSFEDQRPAGRCLYIESESFSGLRDFLNIPDNKGLPEVIYCLKTTPARVLDVLEMSVFRYKSTDILAAPGFPDDLKVPEPSEWQELLTGILKEHKYSDILIDLTNPLQGFDCLIPFCDEIFLIRSHENHSPGQIEDHKIHEFSSYCQSVSPKLSEHIQIICAHDQEYI